MTVFFFGFYSFIVSVFREVAWFYLGIFFLFLGLGEGFG